MSENDTADNIAKAAAGEGHLGRWMQVAHRIARDKGFWDEAKGKTVLDKALKAALIISEVSEYIEALRSGTPEEQAEELADVALRLFDLAEATGVDLNREMQKKCLKNLQRPRMHGKAF